MRHDPIGHEIVGVFHFNVINLLFIQFFNGNYFLPAIFGSNSHTYSQILDLDPLDFLWYNHPTKELRDNQFPTSTQLVLHFAGSRRERQLFFSWFDPFILFCPEPSARQEKLRSTINSAD